MDKTKIRKYPKDLTGLTFGFLTVIGKYPGDKNANSLWACACKCGSPNCKKTVVVRRGLLTRETCSKQSCGADYKSTAPDSAKTKLFKRSIQKNSKTGITGVSLYGGKYRARMDVFGERLEKTGLTLNEAVLVRESWEELKKIILRRADETKAHSTRRSTYRECN